MNTDTVWKSFKGTILNLSINAKFSHWLLEIYLIFLSIIHCSLCLCFVKRHQSVILRRLRSLGRAVREVKLDRAQVLGDLETVFADKAVTLPVVQQLEKLRVRLNILKKAKAEKEAALRAKRQEKLILEENISDGGELTEFSRTFRFESGSVWLKFVWMSVQQRSFVCFCSPWRLAVDESVSRPQPWQGTNAWIGCACVGRSKKQPSRCPSGPRSKASRNLVTTRARLPHRQGQGHDQHFLPTPITTWEDF